MSGRIPGLDCEKIWPTVETTVLKVAVFILSQQCDFLSLIRTFHQGNWSEKMEQSGSGGCQIVSLGPSVPSIVKKISLVAEWGVVQVSRR